MTAHREQVYSRSLLCAAVAVVLFCVPSAASAAVFIHEVAWMGTSVSANDEWIELYNDGASTVDLSGWVLSDGVTLSITLSGSVGPHGYFLLERTDDDTVPGISAGVIYTGALANDGRTLTLRREDSALEDQVAGGTDWVSIGGDNTTKHTAQLTTGGWVTAAPTPGGANATEDADTDEEEDEDEDDTETSDTNDDDEEGDGVKISLVQTPRTPGLEIKGVLAAHAGGSVSLHAIPSGISTKLVPSLIYEWNFGDGTTGTGKEVSHVYAFPGMYAVTVHASFAAYEALGRGAVTVLPIDLSLERGSEGQLFVHNDSQSDMDISGYRIQDGAHSFTFPPRTFILARGTITLSPSVLGVTNFSERVVVRAGAGRHIVLGARKADDAAEVAVSAPALLLPVTPTVSAAEPELAGEEITPPQTGEPIILGGQVASAASGGALPPFVTYGGLGVVIMLGIAALFFNGRSA